MKLLRSIALALAAPLILGGQGYVDFETERPPPPTDMSIPVPAAPRVAKPPPAPPRTLPPPKQPVVGADLPPSSVLEMMVRSVLIAVNQANFTENYSVLHALGTRELQTSMKPEDLSKAFATLRKKDIDLTLVLAHPVKFAKLPEVAKDGLLELVGTIPATPDQIDFRIVYFPVAGFWRIDSLTISTASKSGEAQEAAPPSSGAAASAN